MEPATLTTSRLVLRPWRITDLEDVLACMNDDFSRYLPIPRPYSRADGEQFVARRLLESWEANPVFAIEVGGRVIGDINVRITADHARGECGWGIGSQWWGRGLVTEAARAVMAWAFDGFTLHKIEATADAENVASWRVMEKLGMQREGYLRSHRVLRGERRDVVYYGILRDEFERASVP